jgi:uncharacterized membrane protein
MSDVVQAYLLIFALAAATYGTRIGGDLVLSRFKHINPRVEAALDAVPIAVMTAIVVPMALATGIAETCAVAVTILSSFRLQTNVSILAGVLTVAALRAAGF